MEEKKISNEPKLVVEGDQKVYYTNVAQVRSNPFDIEFLFARSDVVEKKENDEVLLHSAESIRILMTYSHAEAFMDVLKGALGQRKKDIETSRKK